MQTKTKYLIFVVILLIISIPTYISLRKSDLLSRLFLRDKQIATLNAEIEKLSVLYIDAPEAQKPQISDIKKLAEERRTAMVNLAHDNPRSFLANTLTSKQLEKLPPELQQEGLVEKPETVTGQLIATQLENFDTKEVRTDYAIQTSDINTIYSLNTTDDFEAQSVQIGADITATGISLGATIVVDNNVAGTLNVSSITTDTEPLPGSDHKTLIITFNFLNDKNNLDTPAQMSDKIFNNPDSSKRYFLDSSYGQVNLVGTAVGPFTIPYNKLDGQCNDYYAWAIAADAMAFSSGVDVNSYTHKIYSFPRPDNCWAGAWADIGGPGSTTATRAYIPGTFNSGVITHEIGHNLGFSHANFQQCSASSTDNQILYTNPNCASAEYGDPYDVMGHHYDNYRSINAPHRAQVGWLKAEQILKVDKTGTYSLTPLNNKSTGYKTLVIPMSSLNSDYYLEYRVRTGFDTGVTDGESTSLQIRAFAGYSTSLLDANLSLEDSSRRHASSQPTSSFLQVGDTFVDSTDGLKITLKSIDGSEAVVDVVIDNTLCRRQDPEISISPSYISAALNEKNTFVVTVTNKDSLECSPTYLYAYAYANGAQSDKDNSQYLESFAPGQTISFDYIGYFDYRSTLGDHKVVAFANTVNMGSQAEAIYSLTGTVKSVQINPTSITTTLSDSPTHLSALAYDNYSRPVWENLTYDWSMSSDNSVGTVHSDVNIADFIPLKEGRGDLFVIVRRGEDSAVGSISVTVNPSLLSPPPSIASSPSASPSASPSTTPSTGPSAPPSISPSPSGNPGLNTQTGDLNGDGHVNNDDLQLMLSNFGNPYTIYDYNVLVLNYGK